MTTERTLAGNIALTGDAEYADTFWDGWMNANLLKLSTLVQSAAQSLSTVLPGAPEEGDVYIVPSDAEDNANDLAVFDDDDWTYYTPQPGWLVWVIDEGAFFYWDAEWTELAAGGGGGGATDFTDLDDVPSNYTGAALKLVRVNAAGDGLEFVAASGGASATLTENAQTGTAYTLVLADAPDVVVSLANAAAITLTIPDNASVAIPVGSYIQVWQKGAGQVGIVGDGGVTVAVPEGASAFLRGLNSFVTLYKSATDTWQVLGDLATDGTVVDAENVAYDNSTSGLSGTNSQEAIDELAVNVPRATFSANKNSVDQSIADNALTKITYGTEAFDRGSYYDTATSRWTPPAGIVRICGQVSFGGGGSTMQSFGSYVYKNGALLASGNALSGFSATRGIRIPFDVIDQANGTDYYEVYALLDVTAGTPTVNGSPLNSFFQGHWLSP